MVPDLIPGPRLDRPGCSYATVNMQVQADFKHDACVITCMVVMQALYIYQLRMEHAYFCRSACHLMVTLMFLDQHFQ